MRNGSKHGPTCALKGMRAVHGFKKCVMTFGCYQHLTALKSAVDVLTMEALKQTKIWESLQTNQLIDLNPFRQIEWSKKLTIILALQY